MKELINQKDKQGRFHGKCVSYWESGKIKLESHYHHGILHGVSKGYWKDGRCSWMCSFHYGKIKGLQEDYENGILYFKEYYIAIK
jgi:antitoxin component YwqK of YwqJK toxin-antitoxin module